MPEPGVPESFKVLIKELNLGLNIKVMTEDNEEVEIREYDEDINDTVRAKSKYGRHRERKLLRSQVSSRSRKSLLEIKRKTEKKRVQLQDVMADDKKRAVGQNMILLS